MLRFELLSPHARKPERAYEKAVGYDLYACIVTESGNPSLAHILPWTSRAIPTGLILVAPDNAFLAICSRSGMALHKPPVIVGNAPGIVDPDYRGEIKVILFNGGRDLYTVRHGERIAQVVVLPLLTPELDAAGLQDDQTERGNKGFGSTGK
jgi:dUTP pyrophosphatase